MNNYKKYLIFIVTAFLAIGLIGGCLLALPISSHSPKNTFINSLFNSFSALSTTGMLYVKISDHNFFGRIIILVLVQLGGIFSVIVTSFVWSYAKYIYLTRKQNTEGTKSPFINDPKKFLLNTIYYVIFCEVIGSLILFGSLKNDVHNEFYNYWIALFQSINAFCTSGLTLYPDSGSPISANMLFQSFTLILGILGSLGYVVLNDIFEYIKSILFFRKDRFISFITKSNILLSFLLIITPTILVYIFGDNKNIFNLIFNFTQAIITGGLSDATLSSLSQVMYLVIFILVIIGGIKISNIIPMLSGLKSALGETKPMFMGKEIPIYRAWNAIAVFSLYIIFFVIFSLIFSIINPSIDVKNIFMYTVSLLSSFKGLIIDFPNHEIIGKVFSILGMIIGMLGSKAFILYFLVYPKSFIMSKFRKEVQEDAK